MLHKNPPLSHLRGIFILSPPSKRPAATMNGSDLTLAGGIFWQHDQHQNPYRQWSRLRHAVEAPYIGSSIRHPPSPISNGWLSQKAINCSSALPWLHGRNTGGQINTRGHDQITTL